MPGSVLTRGLCSQGFHSLGGKDTYLKTNCYSPTASPIREQGCSSVTWEGGVHCHWVEEQGLPRDLVALVALGVEEPCRTPHPTRPPQ